MAHNRSCYRVTCVCSINKTVKGTNVIKGLLQWQLFLHKLKGIKVLKKKCHWCGIMIPGMNQQSLSRDIDSVIFELAYTKYKYVLRILLDTTRNWLFRYDSKMFIDRFPRRCSLDHHSWKICAVCRCIVQRYSFLNVASSGVWLLLSKLIN